MTGDQLKTLFIHLALASKKIDEPAVKKGIKPKDIAQLLSGIEHPDESSEYNERIDVLRRRIERFKYLSP